VFVTSVTANRCASTRWPSGSASSSACRRCRPNHPSRLKFLDRVSYYGQESELDPQGRIVVPPLLRESASIVGDVRVFGKIDYLEVWNDERFAQKLARDQ